MDKKEILIRFQEGQLSLEEAASLLEGIDDMGFASLDLSRNKRNGFPEIIYGEGKTKEQIEKIIESLESGELSLDDAIREYENAMKLIKSSSKILNEAEGKLLKVIEKNGEIDIEEI